MYLPNDFILPPFGRYALILVPFYILSFRSLDFGAIYLFVPRSMIAVLVDLCGLPMILEIAVVWLLTRLIIIIIIVIIIFIIIIYIYIYIYINIVLFIGTN